MKYKYNDKIYDTQEGAIVAAVKDYNGFDDDYPDWIDSVIEEVQED